jgi:hypothetical protein
MITPFFATKDLKINYYVISLKSLFLKWEIK